MGEISLAVAEEDLDQDVDEQEEHLDENAYHVNNGDSRVPLVGNQHNKRPGLQPMCYCCCHENVSNLSKLYSSETQERKWIIPDAKMLPRSRQTLNPTKKQSY